MAGNDHGGAETAFVDTCIAMKDAGMTVEAVTRPNPVRVPALEAAGIKVHKLPFGGPVDVFTTWKLGKIIKSFSPLIVQTWMSRGAVKTPNWKSVKSAQPYLVVPRLGGYYKIKNFKSADYFNVVTPDLKRHLMDSGVAENKIRIVNNFAETESDVVPVHKTDFGIPLDAPVTISLGRLHSSKAYDILLQAMAELPGVYALIAGEGPDRAALEHLAQGLGVADRVKFIGWRTDRSALLRMADICIFASRVEPFGTVFAQAWAERTPVIVSDADGPRQFCRTEEDCLMVPKEDAGALRDAIARLLEDKSLQQKLTENGYRRYTGEFTKEKTVTAYMDYFIEILKRERIL